MPSDKVVCDHKHIGRFHLQSMVFLPLKLIVFKYISQFFSLLFFSFLSNSYRDFS